LQIRSFTMDDYEAVYALWQSTVPAISLRPSDQRQEIAKKIMRDPDLFLLAEEDDRIVGVVMGAWDGRRGWLHHLAVDERYRCRGIATALLQEVEQRLRAKGCLKVNLLVQRDNAGARQLYKRLGYEEMASLIAVGKEL
jgi:ribosomal protein S18 acetylase RimI-like enzyme